MDPEKRIFAKRIKLFVKLQVVFVFQFAGRLAPDRIRVVDNPVFGNGFVFGFTFGIYAVFFAFVLGAELDFNRQELAVFLKNALDAPTRRFYQS